MNYIIVTGLLIAAAYFTVALSRYLSYKWKSHAYEIFSTIGDHLVEPVDGDAIRRARSWCMEGKKLTATAGGDEDNRLMLDLFAVVAVIVLFGVLGWLHNDAMSDLRKQLEAPKQEQAQEQPKEQPAAQEEQQCTEQK